MKLSLKYSFLSGVRWSIAGSIVYESIKIAHQIALLKIIGISSYGAVGMIFSYIYLTIHVADLESSTTLLPYLNELKKSQERFISFLAKYFLVNTCIMTTGAFIAQMVAKSLLNKFSCSFIFLISGIIISEGTRLFLRGTLHSLFLGKKTVLIDLLATMGYFIILWVPFIKGSITSFSLPLIFIPYLISSLGGAIGLSLLLVRFIKKLPSHPDDQHLSVEFFKKMTKTRILNSTAHLSKHFFSGNFMTTLFAAKFSLEQAGLLKFSAYLADSIKALIHVSIGFPGSALLARLKDTSITIKKRGFSALWKTYNSIAYPLLIFIAINHKGLFALWSSMKPGGFAQSVVQAYSVMSITHPLFITSMLLFCMSFIENFFTIYEEFYLIEENTGSLLFFKLFELSLLTLLVIYQKSPLIILINAVFFRVMTFTMLAIYAYIRWKIKPSWQPQPKIIFLAFIVSFTFLMTYKAIAMKNVSASISNRNAT